MPTKTRRDHDVQVNLEQVVYRTLMDLAPKLGHSASSYVRSLIMSDLRARGLLTDAMLADMAVSS